MGNDNTKAPSKFGHIFIQTEKPFYFSGETVNGTIYMQLTAMFPGKKLYLKIKGKEECRWEETETVTDINNRNHQVTHLFEGKNDFYKHKVPIYNFSGDFMPTGQYSFPFCFAMGDHLPGSFRFISGQNKTKGIIKYKVKAECESFQDEYAKDLKSSQELVLREPIHRMITSKNKEINSSVSTWCCIEKGNVFLRVYFEKDAYVPGEIANVMVEIDNSNCKLNIEKVNFCLRRNISLRSKTGRVINGEVHYFPRFRNYHGETKNLAQDVIKKEFEGLAAGKKQMDGQKRMMSMHLDETLHSTTSGETVKCFYNLVIDVIMDGCTCCAGGPKAEIPVVIYAPMPFNYGQMIAPPNWNPQVMPVYNATLSDNYLYQGQGANVNQPQMNNPNLNNQQFQPMIPNQY